MAKEYDRGRYYNKNSFNVTSSNIKQNTWFHGFIRGSKMEHSFVELRKFFRGRKVEYSFLEQIFFYKNQKYERRLYTFIDFRDGGTFAKGDKLFLSKNHAQIY